MRRTFFNCLHSAMVDNENIYFITCDLGYGLADKIREDFPDRFYNVGASEQAGMGIAVGMALENKIPVIYSITPFLLFRPYETIRNYINHEKIPVKLVGSGRNLDYGEDGFSHHGEDDIHLIHTFKNIKFRWPSGPDNIPALVDLMLNTPEPFYINLKR